MIKQELYNKLKEEIVNHLIRKGQRASSNVLMMTKNGDKTTYSEMIDAINSDNEVGIKFISNLMALNIEMMGRDTIRGKRAVELLDTNFPTLIYDGEEVLNNIPHTFESEKGFVVKLVFTNGSNEGYLNVNRVSYLYDSPFTYGQIAIGNTVYTLSEIESINIY